MKKFILYLLIFSGVLISCEDDLNVTPIDPDMVFGEQVYSSFEGYEQVLAKIYGSYNVSGQLGNNNESDLSTIEDGGMSAYLRNYWNFQTLPTGEVINTWGDGGLEGFQTGAWSSDNQYVAGMFYRIYYMIALTNEFLRESASGGVVEANSEAITEMRAEARLIRVIAYYHGLDLFGQMSIIEENSKEKYPVAEDNVKLFNWLVSQLENEIIPDLPGPDEAEYGKMDAGTAYMVLAKLYINANVFTGVANPVEGKNSYDEVIKYTELVNAAYDLDANYLKLFSIDNDEATGVIFGLAIDGANTQGFAASQYLISAGSNSAFGPFLGLTDPTASWGGNHATRSIYDKFQLRPAGDLRGLTATATEGTGLDYRTTLIINSGLDMDNPNDFTQGLNICKFRNRSSDGTQIGANEYFVDTDWPMFRLADSYLMYAEAVLRGGNGSMTTALTYVNDIIARGYGNHDNDISQSELTLDFLLEERGREFYWEGYRRQDLIRFGKFTSSQYLWPWKGGVENGRGLESYRNIYPIPASELASNPNAVQNPGY